MIKEGDYLICKKVYYIFDDEKMKDKIFNRLFKTPTFIVNRKYKIETVLINDVDPYVINCQMYKSKIKIKFSDEFISTHFYTKVEERKLKLKKLKI